MAVGAVVARILTQYSDKGSKAASKDINKLGKNFDKFAKKSAKAFGIAAAAAAVFAVKIGKDAVQAAIADQKSQALLANSLRNTVAASDSQIASVEKNITALQKQFKVVDDDLRPAFGRLAGAFGSTEAASSALQLALDVSADSGVDLATASDAIIKASQGQFRSIRKLVPALTSATIATKDFGKISDEVSKLTGGAAAKRAETLEYKLMGLKIAFGEILETLGYALLPILEKFATIVSTQILPQLENFIAANKEQLASSFQVAADAAVKFLTVAIAFGDWVSNNTGKVKLLAGIIAGMFVVSGIASFITMLAGISAGLIALRTLAASTGIALAFATGGTSAIAGGVAALAITAAVYGASKSGYYGGGSSKPTATYKSTENGYLGSMPVGSAIAQTPVSPVTTALSKFTSGLNSATRATKAAQSLQDQINAAAARKNLARQSDLSGSPTIAIGARGSKPFGNRGLNVTINADGLSSTKEDLIKDVIDGLERNTRRTFGGGGRFANQTL